MKKKEKQCYNNNVLQHLKCHSLVLLFIDKLKQVVFTSFYVIYLFFYFIVTDVPNDKQKKITHKTVITKLDVFTHRKRAICHFYHLHWPPLKP